MKIEVLVAITLLCGGLAQAATVEIEFVQPEKFSDIGTGRNAETNLTALSKHLSALGAQKLPAQQLLKIAITDVDLAGQQPPLQAQANSMRVMGTGADWPRIQLRYRLTDGDRVVAEGEEKITDMNYLDGKRAPRANDPVPYETRMLTAWFDRTFKAAAAKR
jgi:hypothetical protein